MIKYEKNKRVKGYFYILQGQCENPGEKREKKIKINDCMHHTGHLFATHARLRRRGSYDESNEALVWPLNDVPSFVQRAW